MEIFAMIIFVNFILLVTCVVADVLNVIVPNSRYYIVVAYWVVLTLIGSMVWVVLTILQGGLPNGICG